MYRTCTIAVYDVLDEVFINATVMTYPDTPGTTPPERNVYAAQVISRGHQDDTLWLWDALQGLQALLDSQE